MQELYNHFHGLSTDFEYLFKVCTFSIFFPVRHRFFRLILPHVPSELYDIIRFIYSARFRSPIPSDPACMRRRFSVLYICIFMHNYAPDYSSGALIILIG